VRPLLALLLAASLAGCAGVQPRGPAPQAAWVERVGLLSQTDDWRLLGRVAIRVADDGWSASLLWRQHGEDFSLRVLDPLGRTLAGLEGVPGAVVLREEDGAQHAAADAQGLLMARLGWSLPLEGMRHWVLGLPAPGAAMSALVLDAVGRPLAFEQEGWALRFTRYASAEVDALPEQLTLEREGLRIRLVVDRWELSPA
jgi:outer membrane lipoprotein LolB